MKEIKLTRGKVAIVDDEDYEWINQWKWHCNGQGYAERHCDIPGKRTMIKMHRLILNTPNGMETDHINHNRLDNRKSNLRVCTRSQNAINTPIRSSNTSGKKGVDWKKNVGKWRVRICFQYELMELGYFDNIEDAADAYKRKAKELFGEFAYTE